MIDHIKNQSIKHLHKSWGIFNYICFFPSLYFYNHFIYVLVALVTLLTHWGRVTHICVGKLTIIDWDNGLSPERRRANIWTNAGILLIGTLGTNSIEILSEIHTFSLKKMHLKTSSAKRRPFCIGLNVLTMAGDISWDGHRIPDKAYQTNRINGIVVWCIGARMQWHRKRQLKSIVANGM